jgi:osmotically-inducible protein OsmY
MVDVFHDGIPPAADQGGGAADPESGDARISSAVHSKILADRRVSALEIDVYTADGIVMLNGDVRTRAEATHAARLARGVGGVRKVVDNLQLGRR